MATHAVAALPGELVSVLNHAWLGTRWHSTLALSASFTACRTMSYECYACVTTTATPAIHQQRCESWLLRRYLEEEHLGGLLYRCRQVSQHLLCLITGVHPGTERPQRTPGDIDKETLKSRQVHF